MIVLEPLGTVTVGFDLGVGWPENGPPCVTGWYVLVAATSDAEVPADRVVYTHGADHGGLPDWARVFTRIDPWSGLRAQFPNLPEGISGLCGDTDLGRWSSPRPTYCLPAEALAQLFGDACIWPCEGDSFVVSNEVLVWVEAEADAAVGRR